VLNLGLIVIPIHSLKSASTSLISNHLKFQTQIKHTSKKKETKKHTPIIRSRIHNQHERVRHGIPEPDGSVLEKIRRRDEQVDVVRVRDDIDRDGGVCVAYEER